MSSLTPDQRHGSLHNKMLGMASDTIQRISTLPGFMKAMLRDEGWRRLIRPLDQQMFENATIEAWVLGPPWPGLHFPDWATVYALLSKNVEDGPECIERLQQAGAPNPSDAERAFRVKAAKDSPELQSASEAGAKGGRGNKAVDDVNSFPKGGNGASYLARRLLRDHKDTYFAALERGEYPSVRAAAKAAGIVKERTPLQILKTAWSKATTDERVAFRVFIEVP